MTAAYFKAWRGMRIAALFVVGPLSAVGCDQSQKPFDMGVVHGAFAHATIAHPRPAEAAEVRLEIVPAEQGGCYELPADLMIAANGVPAAAVGLDVQTTTDGWTSACDRYHRTTLTAALTAVDATGPVSVDIWRGSDHAVIEIQPVARPPLELTWVDPPAGTAGGTETRADLTPIAGAVGDVPVALGCWEAWFCAPGSEAMCGSRQYVGISAEPTAQGARLGFAFYDHLAPGERALWLAGSESPGCTTPAISNCSGLATCDASADNHGYLLGPYAFQVR